MDPQSQIFVPLTATAPSGQMARREQYAASHCNHIFHHVDLPRLPAGSLPEQSTPIKKRGGQERIIFQSCLSLDCKAAIDDDTSHSAASVPSVPFSRAPAANLRRLPHAIPNRRYLGDMRLRDPRLSRSEDTGWTQFRRRRVDFIFHFHNLIPSLFALESVVLATKSAGDPRDSWAALPTIQHHHAQFSKGRAERPPMMIRGHAPARTRPRHHSQWKTGIGDPARLGRCRRFDWDISKA